MDQDYNNTKMNVNFMIIYIYYYNYAMLYYTLD